MDTIPVSVVILALLQTVVTSPELSSNATTTIQLSSTAVDHGFNAETLVLKSKMLFNGIEKEASNTLDYSIMKMGDENQWRGLLYCALRNNESIRVTIKNIMPTYYIFQSCNVNFWMTPKPIERGTIDFTRPWIEYLVKLLNTCSTKSQFAVYTANKNYTSSGRSSDARVNLFLYNINEEPIETDLKFQEISIRGKTTELLNVKINSLITKALNSNSSSPVVLTIWSSEAAELRLAKCGFSFNYTINIRPNSIFTVDRNLLDAFNMIKHTYCSNGTDDDLSFQLLVTPPSVNTLIRFSLLPIPEGIPGSSAIYFNWHSMSAAVIAIFLICYVIFLYCAYRQNQETATYYVIPRIVVHPLSRKSFSNA